MTLIFNSLTESHFPLLLKWLEAPHVKAWWDQDISWTPELIQEKYRDYVQGYKIENNVRRTIHSYIIEYDNKPIGYFQIYNAYDFPRSKSLEGLPCHLAAFDIFIGEEKALKCGLASQALNIFLKNYLDPLYTHIFTAPDLNNLAAIKTYKKVGFKQIVTHLDTKETWMLKDINLKK